MSGEAVWVWALIALTAFGAVLRFHWLGSQSYWGDEDGTIYWARGSIKGLIVGTSFKEATPPLYFVAAWMWAKFFGLGEIGMRSLSALAGTATIPVVYLSGRTLASRRVGLIAAAFAATSPLLLWYSQEARSYAFFVLFTSLGLLMFARTLRTGSMRNLAAWAALCDVSLATHYFAAFAIVPEAVWLLASRPEYRRATVAATLQIAAFAALLAPLAIRQQEARRVAWISRIPLDYRIGQIPRQFVFGFTSPPTWLTVAVAALALIGLAAPLVRFLLGHGDPTNPAGKWAALCLVMLLVPILVAAGDVITRNLLYAWVPFAIAVAVIIAAQPRYLALAVGGVMSLLLAAAFVASESQISDRRPDWRGAAQVLGPAVAARVIVPPVGNFPSDLYLAGVRAMPAMATVTEVDVIGQADPSQYGRDAAPGSLLSCWWGAACSVRSAPLPAVPPSPLFHLAERRPVGALTVLRYTSSAPVTLTRADVLTFASVNRLSASLLEQRP
jgi:mannosyltransferase